MGKGSRGQIRFSGPGCGGRIVEHVADYHKSGQQAHDNRVPEDGGHGNVGLYFRVFGVGGSRGDGGGADTGLVGEKASGDAVPQGPP